MNTTIDLNADLGEGGTHDAMLIPLASSVNIACGGHAGDESTLAHAIQSARAAGVAPGAHPGYEDRDSFGRSLMQLPPDEVHALMTRQLQRFIRIARSLEVPVHHVKPHGALYLQASQDGELAMSVVQPIARLLPGCLLYAPPRSCLQAAGEAVGLRVIPEAFADRRYLPDGQLVPRGHPEAVIADPAAAIQQAMRIVQLREVLPLSGPPVPLQAGTLCVHGDGPSALALLRSLRSALEVAGFRISRP